MKKLIISFILTVCLLFFPVLSFAGPAERSQNIKSEINTNFANPETEQGWKLGIKHDYGFDFVKMFCAVSVVGEKPDQDGNTLVGVIITITAQCMDGKKKLSIVSQSAWCFVFDKEDVMLGCERISAKPLEVKPGWDGLEI